MATPKLRLIILGAPGSGKGTISGRLVKTFRLTHLSTGDILRRNIEQKTELGAQAKDTIDKGHLLPDEFITKVVAGELKRVANESWLLDGFPRTLPQAKSLTGMHAGLDRVINLNVPKDVIINRLSHRWIHPASGRVYNMEFNPPKQKGIDDITGEKLVQRADDSKEVVLARLKVYEEQTKPLIEYYNSMKKLETFTGNTSDYLWPLIQSHVQKIAQSSGGELAPHYANNLKDPVTHTGQKFAEDDYRRVRFVNVVEKVANPNHAIDLVAKDPIVVADQRVVWSSSGSALGHPRIYLRIDADEVHDCGYSGRRFIQKKFYDEKKHGPSITFEEYLEDLERREQVEQT